MHSFCVRCSDDSREILVLLRRDGSVLENVGGCDDANFLKGALVLSSFLNSQKVSHVPFEISFVQEFKFLEHLF